MNVTSQILKAAVINVRNYSIRAYDAVQLASAVTVRNTLLVTKGNSIAFTLVSADAALNDAARLDGVPVENPNAH